MPQIIVKGVKEEEMKEISMNCAPVLAKLCDCPDDWFVFDYVQSKFYDVTGEIKHWPVVQVWWFERPQQVQDSFAECIENRMRKLGYPGSQISFHIFKESAYYEEGQHF